MALIPIFATLRQEYFPTELEMATQDVKTIIKEVPYRIFSQGLNYDGPTLTTYKQDEEICGKNGESCSGWGEWVMKISKLDSTKWEFSNNALSPKSKSGELCGYIFEFVPTTQCCEGDLDLLFDIHKIKSDDRFCQELKTNYQNEILHPYASKEPGKNANFFCIRGTDNFTPPRC